MAFPPYGTAIPSLAQWQMQYQGLTLGAGTSYPLTNLQGFGDLPVVRTGDIGRPRDQGEFTGLDLLGGRDTTAAMWVAPTASVTIQALLLSLAGVTPVGGNTESPLWVQLPNLPLLGTMARVRKRTIPYDLNFSAVGLAKPTIQWHSTDPRLYAAPQSATVGLGTPLGGLTFPVTFPATFGGGTSAGVISANNTGNFEMRPILIITGPCTNPSVSNASIAGNPKLTFSNPSQTSFTLNAGDTLTIDLDLHTVTFVASGTTLASNRRYWVVPGSTWWNLPPGVNSIQFQSQDATAVAGTLQMQYASAYLL